MDLMKQIVERAKANKQRIVLPEGTEERTLRAADRLIADEVVDIILIGNPEEIHALAEKLGLKNIGKATIIDPANNPRKEIYANLLFELRKAKGMTMEKLSLWLPTLSTWVLSSSKTAMPTAKLPVHAIPQVMYCVPPCKSSKLYRA